MVEVDYTSVLSVEGDADLIKPTQLNATILRKTDETRLSEPLTSSSIVEKKQYPIKTKEMVKFMMVVIFFGIIPSYGNSYLNQCAQLLNIKNGWSSTKQEDVY